MRQVPPSSAAAWLLDLGDVRGPRFVVFRCDEARARVALVELLVKNGTVEAVEEAEWLVAAAVSEPVEVIR